METVDQSGQIPPGHPIMTLRVGGGGHTYSRWCGSRRYAEIKARKIRRTSQIKAKARRVSFDVLNRRPRQAEVQGGSSDLGFDSRVEEPLRGETSGSASAGPISASTRNIRSRKRDPAAPGGGVVLVEGGFLSSCPWSR